MSKNKQNIVDREFVPYQESLELRKLGFDESCFGHYINELYDRDKDFVEYYKIPVSSQVEDSEYDWWDNSNFLSHHNKGNDHISAPTFSQAFRWFREKYKMTSSVRVYFAEEFFYEIYVSFNHEITSDMYNSYEETELACLKKLIELVKEKHNIGDSH